jgi:hypothetical protein
MQKATAALPFLGSALRLQPAWVGRRIGQQGPALVGIALIELIA